MLIHTFLSHFSNFLEVITLSSEYLLYLNLFSPKLFAFGELVVKAKLSTNDCSYNNYWIDWEFFN